MADGTLIYWLAIGLGAVFIVSIFHKIKKMPKMSPVLAGLIGVGLIGFGAIGVGYMDNPFEATPEAQIADTTDITDCASFQITPSVSSSEATLNSDETQFTVGARANTTAHTITETDNTTWVNPVLQFVVKPQAYAGADADNLATIYYEVVNPEITTTDGTDTYKLFTKSSGKRQLIWTGDSTEYVSGSSTMLLTENLTLTLTMTCSQDSFSRIENTYDPVTISVRFYNNCGWTQTYQVDLMLIETYT